MAAICFILHFPKNHTKFKEEIFSILESFGLEKNNSLNYEELKDKFTIKVWFGVKKFGRYFHPETKYDVVFDFTSLKKFQEE